MLIQSILFNLNLHWFIQQNNGTDVVSNNYTDILYKNSLLVVFY